MKCALLFPLAAALAPLAAQAQPPGPPSYRVRLDWQRAEPGPGGLVIRGRVTNTGTTPLFYTQVTPTLVDGAGNEVFRGSGYLTASPLLPGRSAEFRACEPDAPRFAGLRMVFREAGHPVRVQGPQEQGSLPWHRRQSRSDTFAGLTNGAALGMMKPTSLSPGSDSDSN